MAATADQRRERARQEYNAFLAQCPSRQLLDRISDKWVVLVLCALASDVDAETATRARSMPLRYSRLARLIAGVSQKMLTQTLRSLERDGLISRTVTPTVPVTVTYELTPLGLSLHDTLREVRAWAQAHMDEVAKHRNAHDAAGAHHVQHAARHES